MNEGYTKNHTKRGNLPIRLSLNNFIICLTLLVTFSTTSFITSAGGYMELPRGFGILKMGMSDKNFIQLTGILPETCAMCTDKETLATLTGDQLSDLDINPDSDGADIFFYNHKLYLISAGTIVKDFYVINEDLENEFGGPGEKLATSNHIAMLRWEDNNTVVTLNYHKKEKRVFSVNYYDWEAKQERDWQNERAHDTKTVKRITNRSNTRPAVPSFNPTTNQAHKSTTNQTNNEPATIELLNQ